MYICSASMVSPQASFEQLLTEPALYTGENFSCIEPDYSKYIDPKLIRRMSRIIKMGVAAAMESLKSAEIKNPDAIITGTAYGCLADTDAFLTRMVEFNEELLSPTAFIQSTHNTVGAQIALMLQCHNYNNTYVHRGSSFESAMLDAGLLLNEGEAKNILVGAVDEIIEKSHTILRRFDLYKQNGDSAQLFNSNTDGTMAGEGATFFVLGKEKTKGAVAKLIDIKTYYKPSRSVENIIKNFMMENGITNTDIDLVVMGNNGDATTDAHYAQVANHVFPQNKLVGYKNYCGEYPTSSAFALWMATKMIEHGKHINSTASPKMILIYNNYKLHYPSLFLLSAC
jgi:3-oxoacyl-[acyl-carrier-protein] synthase II